MWRSCPRACLQEADTRSNALLHLLCREAAWTAMAKVVAVYWQLSQVLQVGGGEVWEGALAVDDDVDKASDVGNANVLSMSSFGKGAGNTPPTSGSVSPQSLVQVAGLWWMEAWVRSVHKARR